MFTSQIIFDHRGRAGEGLGPVEIRVIFNRKAIYFNTGIKIFKKNFVGGTIVNQADSQELNARLQIIYNKVQEELTACIADGVEPSAAVLRRKVWQADEYSRKDSTALIDFIEEQESVMQLAEGTLKHYRTLRARLHEYGQMLSWRDVTAENICKFDAWLHKIKKPQSDAEKKQGKAEEFISDTAVYTYHKCLKAIIRRAVLFDKIDRNPYDKLRGMFKRGDKESVEFLTEDEMAAVESLHPVPGSQMAVARDLFVFQMHTGLSYADTQAFDFGEYRNVNGKWVNVGRRVKTGIQYVVQLSSECERILESYGWQLPKILNSDYNKCLKALGAAIGIDKPLHSHLARHSFATKMTAGGAAIQNVSRMLGHASVTQTQRYAKVLPESVMAEFDKIEEILKKENV